MGTADTDIRISSKLKISTADFIFSHVVATLSDSILKTLQDDTKKVLLDLLSTEKVTLTVDTAGQVCSIVGLLDDVITCHEKLHTLFIEQATACDQTSEIKERPEDGKEVNNDGNICDQEGYGEDTANVLNEDTANILNEDTANILNEDTANIVNEDTANILNEDTANILNEDTANVLNEDTANILNEDTANILNEDTANILNVETDHILNEDEADNEVLNVTNKVEEFKPVELIESEVVMDIVEADNVEMETEIADENKTSDCGLVYAGKESSVKTVPARSYSGLVKHWKKRRKVLHIERKDEVVVDSPSDTVIVSKRGRVIKRPSKLASSVLLSDKQEEVLESLEPYQVSRKSKTLKRSSVYKEQKIKEEKEFTDSENSELYTVEKLIDKTTNDNITNIRDKKKQIRRHYEDKMPYRYFCSKCSFQSKRVSHLHNHMELHEKNPDMELIRCDKCDFKCIRQSLLKRHQLCHETEVFQCGRCKYKTVTKAMMDLHMAKAHRPQKIYKLNCSLCTFSAFTRKKMANHIDIHHSKTKTSHKLPMTFSCNECSYSTTRKVHFERHKRHVHSNRRPYLCDLCGAAFKRTDTLGAHKLTHLDRSKRVLPFVCGQCGKNFKSKAHLMSHMSVHSSIRAFQCHICGQMFKTRQVQQKHQENIHYNPRSFKCTVCNKEFNTKYTLQRHVRTHDTDLVQQAEARVLAQAKQTVEEDFDDQGRKDGTLDKGGLEQAVETIDENMSAIQHITLSEFTQQLQNTADHMQQGADIGTIYIEGLETVVPESGTINIVNMNGQDIRQIVLPTRAGTTESQVNVINQYITQLATSAGPSSVNQDSSKGNNSTGVITDGGLSEIYVSTVNVGEEVEGGLTDGGEIDQVYIQTDPDIHEIKHILVSTKYDPTSIEESGNVQTGEIIIDETGSLVKHDMIQQ